MELDSEARHILELAEQARSPNQRDKARVEHKLALALGAAAAASAGVGGGVGVASASQHASAGKSVAGVWALQHVVVGTALLVAGTTAYLMLAGPRAPAAVETPAVQTPAAVRAPAELAPQPSASPTAAAADGTGEEAPDAHARTRPHHAVADTLAAEVDLLHRAQAAWRARDAKGALALLREHRARHPHSALSLERDALQALLLCELGKQDEGARIGRNVLKSAPDSPMRASIEQSCALK